MTALLDQGAARVGGKFIPFIDLPKNGGRYSLMLTRLNLTQITGFERGSRQKVLGLIAILHA